MHYRQELVNGFTMAVHGNNDDDDDDVARSMHSLPIGNHNSSNRSSSNSTLLFVLYVLLSIEFSRHFFLSIISPFCPTHALSLNTINISPIWFF